MSKSVAGVESGRAKVTHRVSLGMVFELGYEVEQAATAIRGVVGHIEKLKPGHGAVSPAEINLSLLYVLGRLEKAGRRFEEATR